MTWTLEGRYVAAFWGFNPSDISEVDQSIAIQHILGVACACARLRNMHLGSARLPRLGKKGQAASELFEVTTITDNLINKSIEFIYALALDSPVTLTSLCVDEYSTLYRCGFDPRKSMQEALNGRRLIQAHAVSEFQLISVVFDR